MDCAMQFSFVKSQRILVRLGCIGILMSAFACGKVTNLSQEAGLNYLDATPLVLPAQELLPVSLEVPYKEIIMAQGGQTPYVYSIKKGELLKGLELNSENGVITGLIDKSLVAQQSIITVAVKDAGGLTAEQSYTVKAAAYAHTIAPSEVPTITPGITFAMKFNAVGGVEPVKYSLGGAVPLKLSLSSEGALVSETGGIASSYADSQWPVEVTATDANNIVSTAKYILRVGSAPQTAALSIMSTQLYGVQVGAYAGGISTVGGIAPLTFSVEGGSLPTGLSMNASTGVVSGTIPTGAANAAYAVVIKVVDAAGQSQTKTFSGTVSPGNSTMTLHTTTMSQMTASIGYSYTLAVTGGRTPYTFAVSSGTMPGGLTLNPASGLISGTVAAGAGGQAYAFVITVTDADGQTVNRTYTGTVSVSSSSSMSIVTTTVPTPTAGSSYLAAIGAMGGTYPYSFSVSSGALPSGLSLNTSSGIISGTVTYAAKGSAYLFTITATDAASLSVSQVYSGFVGAYTTTLVPAALTAATPGASYSVGLATTGGEAPYTYTLTSGALPSGLSLNSSSGIISGTVNQSEAGSTRNFTIRSTDANSVQTSVSYGLTINPFVVTITTSTLANAIESAMYSNSGNNLVATGGTAPYTFQYSGTLPSGIGLTSAGAFFGVAGVGSGALPSGTVYTIYVKATDAAGNTSAQVTLTLTTTISSPVVDAVTPPSAVLGATYSHTITASGGRGPYTYSLQSGSLPTGVTLSTAGVLSGTPISSASCPANNFAVRAVDALGQNSANVNKCIATATGVSISNLGFNTVVVGVNYNATVIATGGSTPYTFTATGLPSGVSLNSSTGALTGYVNDPIGDYTVFISVHDNSSPALTTTRSFTFKVRNPLALSAATLPRAGTGKSYGPVALNATGGETPYSFAITSGSLPAGLTLSSSGSISGTPASNAAAGTGAYTFTVAVTDAADIVATQTYNLYVSVTPRIVRDRLPPAVVGNTYVYDVERVGGVNPFISAANLSSQFTWAATGLPSGLSINTSSGRISGTPAAGTHTSSPYTVNVSVTDANGISSSRNMTMEVRSAALTLDLASARTAEPCPTGGFNCEPTGYAMGKLVPAQTTTQYVAYGALLSGTTTTPTSVALYIARVTSLGAIPSPGSSVYSIAYTPSSVGWITSVDIADVDNDTYPDIVFADRTNNKIVVVWNSGTTNGNGMPVFSTENSFSMPGGGAKPFQVKVGNLRPDATNANKKDILVSDYDVLTPATVARFVVFLAQNACSANCSGTRAAAYSGAGASITAFNTTLTGPGVGLIHAGGVGSGYFDVAPAANVCPSIVITGRRATTSNDDYIYIRRQTYTGSVCDGNFALHAAADEKMVTASNSNGIPSAPAIADFNNDGISDIAVALRWTAMANSANIKIYMMPGGNVFPSNPISPLLPSKTGTNYVAGTLVPYCLNGATSCSYPSLLVAGGRDRAMVISAASTVTSYGFISIIPNQGASPWFEDLTGNNRIDYYAPPGIGNGGFMMGPMITSGKNDIAFMGVDSQSGGTAYSDPYYFMLPRNGSSTTDPFRQMRMARSLPTYIATPGEVGTMKVLDVDGDSQLDIVSHLVAQSALGIVAGDNVTNDPNLMPDPTPNPVGLNFGTPNTWHYQATMDTADFNEDGHPDFVTAGNGTRAVSVNFGDGTSTIVSSFTLEPGTSGELFPRAVVAGDFDNDGHADFITMNYNNNTTQSSMSFFKGIGNGSFVDASEFMLANAIGCGDVRTMAARDLNGDGRLEVAVLCYASQALWILRRHVDGTWVRNGGATVNTGGGNNGTVLSFGRLTSTTGTDLVVGGLDTTNSYRIINGLTLSAPDLSGNFNVSATLNAYQTIRGYLSSAEITDLNNDGFGDIILTPATQNQGTVTVNSMFLYTCRTTAAGACTLDSWGGDSQGLTSISLGDFNNDGKMDFVYGSRNGSRIYDRMISRVLNISY